MNTHYIDSQIITYKYKDPCRKINWVLGFILWGLMFIAFGKSADHRLGIFLGIPTNIVDIMSLSIPVFILMIVIIHFIGNHSDTIGSIAFYENSIVIKEGGSIESIHLYDIKDIKLEDKFYILYKTTIRTTINIQLIDQRKEFHIKYSSLYYSKLKNIISRLKALIKDNTTQYFDNDNENSSSQY